MTKTLWSGKHRYHEYLEPEEAHRLIEAVPRVSRHVERDKLLLQTLWETGGRVSEVIQLQANRIGDESLILHNLKRRDPQTGEPRLEYKEVFTSPELIEKLRDYCTRLGIEGSAYVFQSRRQRHGHVGRWYAWKLVWRCGENAGVQKVNRLKGEFQPPWPHLFRHGCATHILNETDSYALAQKQLGHASMTATENYASLKESKHRELAKLPW